MDQNAVAGPAPTERDAPVASGAAHNGQAQSGRVGPMPAVLVGQGSATGLRLTLDQTTTLIGRAEDCTLQVPDPLASRHHAEIRRDSWRYVLTDLGSRNGTLVNGEPIREPYLLQTGDTILVATTPLRFEDPNATITVAREALHQAHLPLWVNTAAGEAYAFGRRLDLAPKELALLALLYERAGEVCDKDEIAKVVWPEYDGQVSDYNIETLVSRLRHKLAQGGAPPDAIVTIKKRGYRLTSAP